MVLKSIGENISVKKLTSLVRSTEKRFLNHFYFKYTPTTRGCIHCDHNRSPIKSAGAYSEDLFTSTCLTEDNKCTNCCRAQREEVDLVKYHDQHQAIKSSGLLNPPFLFIYCLKKNYIYKNILRHCFPRNTCRLHHQAPMGEQEAAHRNTCRSDWLQ